MRVLGPSGMQTIPLTNAWQRLIIVRSWVPTSGAIKLPLLANLLGMTLNPWTDLVCEVSLPVPPMVCLILVCITGPPEVLLKLVIRLVFPDLSYRPALVKLRETTVVTNGP